jgi:nucleoside-diphosphate-sugar epimerase
MLEKLGLREEDLEGETVLVTGGEGCIGSWAVRVLTLAGIRTVSTDVSAAGMRLGKILDYEQYDTLAFETVDLREPRVLDDIVERHGVTRIVHLAALQVPFVYANPILGSEVNVVGTLRVFETVRASAGRVRGLSYASSAAAVGPSADPHSPETLYGVFKLGNEHAARIYARDYGVASVGLRPCIVYGPNRDQGLTSALTTALKAVALRMPYEIPFSGLVDIQYAEDVASAFILAAFAEGEDAATYDLHGDALTVEAFVEAITEVEPEANGLLSVAPAVIPGNVDMDDTELKLRLGGLSKTSLRGGIKSTLEVFAEHQIRGILTPDETVAGK